MSEIVGLDLLDGLTMIASQAAAAILAAQKSGLDRREKADHSPVTAADQAAERVIFEGLARLVPGVTVISEEATGHRRPDALGRRFILVDPLDGTRELLAGRDEYTVNIALVEDAVPIAGVIAAPATGVIWRGASGRGAERIELSPGAGLALARSRRPIHTRSRPDHGIRVMVSRSHFNAATAAYLDRLRRVERVSCGSAIKFGMLAEGRADLYPRLGTTSEWDVAAGHAVLLAAGGGVVQPNGGPLLYGQSDFRVPAFIAVGDPSAPSLA
jgi:3'(2'), 5'-bisphosphate nucleotidase